MCTISQKLINGFELNLVGMVDLRPRTNWLEFRTDPRPDTYLDPGSISSIDRMAFLYRITQKGMGECS